MTKSELRKALLQKRALMTQEDVRLKSQKIVDQVRNDARYKHAKKVAIFYPMGTEVNLLDLLKDEKVFLFPRVEKDGIHFYPYHKDMTFIRSKFGVLEPSGTVNEDDSIDFMLAPALAISKELYRIGYGKGYYDQFLSKHRPKTVVGVIYDYLNKITFDHDAHDQKLDDVIEG
jgi:5-formyltetrahydrofolate cyclo-ligase